MRLFVAVEPPDSLRDRLVEAVDAMKRRWRARWVRPEQLHLTLRFIGEVVEERIDAIEAALVRAVGERPLRFDLRFAGAGAFPTLARPRVLWYGFAESPEVRELAATVEEQLVSAGLEREERTFRPHLTLARLKERWPPGQAEAWRAVANDLVPEEFWPVDAVRLVSSRLEPGGAVHETVGRYELAGGDS